MTLILNETSNGIHLTTIGSDAGCNRRWSLQTFCLPQQAAFKADSLGVFTKAGTDHAKFSIDSKTGKLTSITAMAAGADIVNVI